MLPCSHQTWLLENPPIFFGDFPSCKPQLTELRWDEIAVGAIAETSWNLWVKDLRYIWGMANIPSIPSHRTINIPRIDRPYGKLIFIPFFGQKPSGKKNQVTGWKIP
jgi:hypothetical protein